MNHTYGCWLRSCFVSLICCLFLFCLLCWRFLVQVAISVVLFLFVIITSSLRALQVVVRYTSKPVKHNPIPPLLANPVNFGQFWNYFAIRVSRICTDLHSNLWWHRIMFNNGSLIHTVCPIYSYFYKYVPTNMTRWIYPHWETERVSNVFLLSNICFHKYDKDRYIPT